MSNVGEHFDTEAEAEAPQKLVGELRKLYGEDLSVPAAVDEAIVARAAQRLARRRPAVTLLRWLPVAAAAAAIILVVLLPLSIKEHQPEPPVGTKLAIREDFDRNGEVDILDAFALAREMEKALEPRSDWDINGDGMVDEKDVDTIALAAVSLERQS